MNKPIIILAVAAMLFAASCTKVLEFNGTETEPIPVLISLPEPDTTLDVRLTLSHFFLSNNQFSPINNASFRVEVNGATPATTFSMQEGGVYRSDLILHEDDTLTLRVSVPGHDDLTAGCRIPFRPVISNLTTTSRLHHDTSYYYYIDSTMHIFTQGNIEINFLLHDPAAQRNYYMLCAYFIDSATGQRQYFVNQIDDNLLFEESINEAFIDFGADADFSYGTKTLFTDERINGRDHSIHVDIDVFGESVGTIYFDIYSLSRDAYLYHATLKTQQNSDDFMGIFSEPVQIHTNISGGIGILGASSPLRLTLQEQ